jgi:hypothetical protein
VVLHAALCGPLSADDCRPGTWKCDDGGCIHPDLHCDGETQCDDGSDERCCSGDEGFRCADNSTCLETSARCDSYPECGDSSDEADCKECADGLFHCDNNKCVLEAFICDSDNDCGDFSDELSCDAEHLDMYECDNGLSYVAGFQLCDGENDCGDLSDEVGCSPCEPFYYQCGDLSTCVLVFDLCDGESQCDDGSDEAHCHICATSGQFMCDNGDCVGNDLVCDDTPDCADQSDEASCHCDLLETEFECPSGVTEEFNITTTCIPLAWRCDGIVDCKLSEDERDCDESTIVADAIALPCGTDQFTCIDGFCLSETMHCDGIHQCDLGEDERGCGGRCDAGKYQLCLTSDECVSYDQFCDGEVDCLDGSDESFDNGFCVCSGVICGDVCVPLTKMCDGVWDCGHGEDEEECTKCRPNLHDSKRLIDETVFLTNMVETTYGEMDNFQIYFGSLLRMWDDLFGTSPLHLQPGEDSDLSDFIRDTEDFLIFVVSLRQPLRQFFQVMNELGFTDKTLPIHEKEDMGYSKRENDPHTRRSTDYNSRKKYVIERSNPSEMYGDVLDRSDYLRQKATDMVEVLSAISYTLHFDFKSCKEEQFLRPLQTDDSNVKKSLNREVFSALTLVRGDVPREQVDEFIDRLYELDDHLDQLLVSVENFDHTILMITGLIEDAKNKLEQALVESTRQSEGPRSRSIPVFTKPIAESKNGGKRTFCHWNISKRQFDMNKPMLQVKKNLCLKKSAFRN